MYANVRRALLGVVAGAIVLTLSATVAAQALEQKLIAGDGAASDLLGFAVAVDGDTAVVGAPGDDSGRGAVYVFTRTGDAWTETAKLTASDGAANDQLGYSVAIDGETIVAGARVDDVGATNQGSAYTFAATGPATRTQTAKLTASDGAEGDRLGNSVAIDGATIVAGAFEDDVGANAFQGSVYTFARNGAAPHFETAKLTVSDGAAGDNFGASVAIDGETIVAGAPLDDVGTSDSQGSAYTFAATGPAPHFETAKLTASDGAEGDFLGDSVAIDGETILTGAPLDDIGANTDQGSAYTFAATGPATRTETAKLTASGATARGQLGFSVAIDGATILAGAADDDVGANGQQGSASVFFAPDTTAPTLQLKAKKKQNAGKPIKVKATANEACTLKLAGSAKPKGEKKGKLKPKEGELEAGIPKTLKLKPKGKLNKALKEAEKGKAKLKGACTDAAGNPSQDALKVKLK